MLEKSDYLSAVIKALVNAEELLEEAVILSKYNKIARAYTLFQFCIEEIGKASLTFQFVMYSNISDNLEVKKFLKNFTNHKEKTSSSMGVDFMYALTTENSGLSKKILDNYILQYDKINDSNNNKNYSLYTSLIESKFYLPSEVISKKQLDDIAFFANLRLKIAKSFFELGVQNFDVLFENKSELNEEMMIEKGSKKMKEILGIK